MKTFSLKNPISKSKKNWKIKLISLFLTLIGFFSLYFFGVIHASIEIVHTQTINSLGAVGFNLKEILIEGHDRLKSSEILNDLKLVQKNPLFSFSLTKIQEDALKNPWIRSIAIQRQLPSTLYFRVVERRPIALWKDEKNTTYMVDDEGDLIHATIPIEYQLLPTIIGQNAHKQTPKIIKIIQDFSVISSRLTGLAFVGERRWDLILDKKLHIQLPEEKTKEALAKLEKLQIDHKIFEKNILKIDLRVAHKTIIKPSPDTPFNVRDGKVVGKKT